MHDDQDTGEPVAGHVNAAGCPRTERDAAARALIDACWRNDGADTSNPVAREWLRMSGPAPVVVALPHCGCAHGPCTICN